MESANSAGTSYSLTITTTLKCFVDVYYTGIKMETVNITWDKKLSQLQKAILRKLGGSDKFWGLRYDYLSWELARELEQNLGAFIDNRKVWREQKLKELAEKRRSGEFTTKDTLIESYFYRKRRGQKDERLTPKWCSSFSRSVKRLEERGFLYRVVEMKIERRDVNRFWVAYTGSGRTSRVVLEAKGREWIETKPDKQTQKEKI